MASTAANIERIRLIRAGFLKLVKKVVLLFLANIVNIWEKSINEV
jgi:hypothetical protein